MTDCLFVTDLHGAISRYEKLFDLMSAEKPEAVFIGGDILPSSLLTIGEHGSSGGDFIDRVLIENLIQIRNNLGDKYPAIFLIMGNDDPRATEPAVIEAETLGLAKYIHNKKAEFKDWVVYGYTCVPPTPYLLKDWERYDVSRYIDPGCVSPEEGFTSLAYPINERKYSTIKKDLDLLTGRDNLSNAVFLFHSPPYNTNLDRAALDGQTIDFVPLDPHVGSIAIREFIENRQPFLTLHGHIHESARLSGSWRDRIGQTYMFTAAHDSPELAVIRFNLKNPALASRVLV
jgi:Icc-related predicted phosphoesterase